MRRLSALLYGVSNYVLFLGLFAYMALFVADAFVPIRIDTPMPGRTPLPAGIAAVVDLLLIAVFGLQHSVMARPGFKAWWTRFVPPVLERSTYMFASSVVLIGVMLLWQPIAGVVWHVEGETARTALWVAFALSWLSIPVYTLMINHFDLFGLQQVWTHFRGTEKAREDFRTPWIYRFVRHPIYLGWMMSAWITPTMTIGHLVWAAGTTVYMLIAIPLEERDLVAEFGADYELYRNRVPGIVPIPGRGVRDVDDIRSEPAA